MKDIVIWILWEFVFYSVCGWTGHHFVKLVTFGKVDLGYGEDCGSVWAELIGLAVLIGLGVIVAKTFF